LAEVFSGFICGFVLSLIMAPLLALMLVRMRVTSPIMARLLPPGVSAMTLTLTLHFALFFFWTAWGILFGLLLLAMRGNGAALGSANAPFSLMVAALTLMISAPFAIVIVPWRRSIIGAALLVIVIFGWLLPNMATWTRFN
jgi:hypothetical protein